jgi:PHD/YefM family antitoxin component YafN of YafNO toxin-antitoxin module
LATLLQAEPTMIYSKNGQRSVVISLHEFSKMSASELESWQETMYLLANPANECHLLESIKQHRNGEASLCLTCEFKRCASSPSINSDSDKPFLRTFSMVLTAPGMSPLAMLAKLEVIFVAAFLSSLVLTARLEVIN